LSHLIRKKKIGGIWSIMVIAAILNGLVRDKRIVIMHLTIEIEQEKDGLWLTEQIVWRMVRLHLK
jgi:hypothetical protein